MDTFDAIVIGIGAVAALVLVLAKVGEYIEDKEHEAKRKQEEERPDIQNLLQLAQTPGHYQQDYAQYRLGVAYYNGRNVPQDYTEAFRWLRTAADLGRSEAVAVLGAMYFAGHGTPKDIVLAHVYFNMAAAKGHDAAKASRDSITPLLSDSQLEKAQRLAREWASTWPANQPGRA